MVGASKAPPDQPLAVLLAVRAAARPSSAALAGRRAGSPDITAHQLAAALRRAGRSSTTSDTPTTVLVGVNRRFTTSPRATATSIGRELCSRVTRCAAGIASREEHKTYTILPGIFSALTSYPAAEDALQGRLHKTYKPHPSTPRPLRRRSGAGRNWLKAYYPRSWHSSTRRCQGLPPGQGEAGHCHRGTPWNRSHRGGVRRRWPPTRAHQAIAAKHGYRTWTSTSSSRPERGLPRPLAPAAEGAVWQAELARQLRPYGDGALGTQR
jgi:hypothetical protein